MTISAILGCRSETNTRLVNDAYQTPIWAAELFADAESLPPMIWEPCAGDGNIASVLRDRGVKVLESDLTPRNRRQKRLDFFAAMEAPAPALVTNPPYGNRGDVSRFIRHAYAIGIEYLALLLKADFMCAGERFYLFEEELGYPTHIWALSTRPDFRNQKGPPMNCGWYVWRKWRAKQSILRILPPREMRT
jgi:hypothetical protein